MRAGPVVMAMLAAVGAVMLAGVVVVVDAEINPDFDTPLVAFDNNMIMAAADRAAMDWESVANCSDLGDAIVDISYGDDHLWVASARQIFVVYNDDINGT
jgi:hypothetical protein